MLSEVFPLAEDFSVHASRKHLFPLLRAPFVPTSSVVVEKFLQLDAINTRAEKKTRREYEKQTHYSTVHKIFVQIYKMHF